jgi:hypothetical protein
LSGNRTERRGDREPEDCVIYLTDRRRTAKPLLDEHDRETREGQDIARNIERLGYEVRIERD